MVDYCFCMSIDLMPFYTVEILFIKILTLLWPAISKLSKEIHSKVFFRTSDWIYASVLVETRFQFCAFLIFPNQTHPGHHI